MTPEVFRALRLLRRIRDTGGYRTPGFEPEISDVISELEGYTPPVPEPDDSTVYRELRHSACATCGGHTLVYPAGEDGHGFRCTTCHTPFFDAAGRANSRK